MDQAGETQPCGVQLRGVIAVQPQGAAETRLHLLRHETPVSTPVDLGVSGRGDDLLVDFLQNRLAVKDWPALAVEQWSARLIVQRIF
jgi:hypothetical protein